MLGLAKRGLGRVFVLKELLCKRADFGHSVTHRTYASEDETSRKLTVTSLGDQMAFLKQRPNEVYGLSGPGEYSP